MKPSTAINFIHALEKFTRPKQKDNMLIGEITQLNPLNVKIRENVILTESFLVLGQMCRPYKVTIPHTHTIDAFLSEKSPSLNNYSNTITANVPVEVISVPEPATYSTYVDNGRETEAENGSIGDWKAGTGQEQKNTVNDLTNGSSVSFSGQASGTYAPVFTGSLKVEDKKHSHIIERHKTLDTHFPNTENEKYVTIEIYPKLKVGDKVLMFAFNDFQTFYIAERLEGGE